MALLIGMEAGQRDERDEFPPDSINGRVTARLREFARLRQQQENPPREEEQGNETDPE
jgi:hypothetical protein